LGSPDGIIHEPKELGNGLAFGGSFRLV